MKRSPLSHALGVSLLTLSLATIPFGMSAFAQTNPDPNGTGIYQDTTPGLETVQNTETGVEGVYDTDDDNGDWGWLGLLGLGGLFGLMGRKRHQETVTYRDREPEREIYR